MTAEPIYRRDVQAENAREEREYKFSEARRLLKFGVHPDRIVYQLRTTRAAMEKLGRNWDQDDIVEAFRTTKSSRRPARHCTDCGQARGGKNAGQRCWDCYRESVAA